MVGNSISMKRTFGFVDALAIARNAQMLPFVPSNTHTGVLIECSQDVGDLNSTSFRLEMLRGRKPESAEGIPALR
jgi:hypothetical protein